MLAIFEAEVSIELIKRLLWQIVIGLSHVIFEST